MDERKPRVDVGEGQRNGSPPIIGTEAVELLDCGDVRGVSIVELKADLAFHFMRHSPRPRFERVEVPLMKLVPDPPELHTRLPPPNGGALGCPALLTASRRSAKPTTGRLGLALFPGS